MEIPSLSSPTGGVAALAAQPLIQPQEQQARNLRTEQERDDVTRADDQVTLSNAARQVAALETERVVPQAEVSAAADQSQEKDRVEQARQAQIEAQRYERPVPSSVARALETYTQTSALSSGNS